MKSKKSNILKKVNKYWNRIMLKDRCLIIIMLILFIQSIYNVFTASIENITSEAIDIVIRTTSASIFGYFISSNFLNKKYPTHKYKKDDIKISCECKIAEEVEDEELKDKELNKNKENYFNLQIIIAASIGIVAITVLIIAREWSISHSISIAALSQFRDFISGCVGFLIGIPESKNDGENK